MRRALGLHGDGPPRQRMETDQPQSGARSMDRFGPGLHRRRFVQDGDVPVTVMRRDSASGAIAVRDSQAGPTSSRLQRVEAALQAETAAKTLAERALADAQTVVRDLQTKIGHAELASREAVERMRRELEAVAAERSITAEREAKLRDAEERAEMAEEAYHKVQTELTAERGARRVAERALREATAAREHAETLVRALTTAPEPEPAPLERIVEAAVEPVTPAEPAAATRGRRPRAAVVPVEAEPEPVKWWLMTKPGAKRK